MIFQNLEPLFSPYKAIAIATAKPAPALLLICVCIDEVTPLRNPYSVSETFELAPILVALILFTSSVILPADVTGDPDIENSEPD